MIRAILFDLDGTLLDRHSSLIVHLHKQLQRCASLLEGVDPAHYIAKVIELDACGHTPKDAVYRGVAEHFDLPADSGRILLEDFHRNFPDTCVPFPRLHQTLDALHKRGLALGVVTNGRSLSQDPKIDGLGIRHYFQSVLVSEAEGIRKPDPEIFLRALRQLDTEPAQAVFVGDNPQADIHAAKAVGMKAVWMRNTNWPEPTDADAAVSNLDEVAGVIEKLNNQSAKS